MLGKRTERNQYHQRTEELTVSGAFMAIFGINSLKAFMEDHEVIETLAQDLWETYKRSLGQTDSATYLVLEWDQVRKEVPWVADAWLAVARRVVAIAEEGMRPLKCQP